MESSGLDWEVYEILGALFAVYAWVLWNNSQAWLGKKVPRFELEEEIAKLGLALHHAASRDNDHILRNAGTNPTCKGCEIINRFFRFTSDARLPRKWWMKIE
jgi:hypothetical protein